MSIAPALAGARCYDIDLVREHWEGRATLVWAPGDGYTELAASAHDMLGPREQDTLATFDHARRRTSYLLGRYAAKLALMRVTGITDGRAIDVVAGCFQQPIVVAPLDVPVGVSISHSATGACAVAFPDGHPMGIDVEEIVPDRVTTMRTQFAAGERDVIARCGDEMKLSAAVWTAKEALSKVLRCGLTVPFELLEVDGLTCADEEVSGVFRHFAQYRFQSWIRGPAVVSLVLPRRTHLKIESPFLR